MKSVRFFKNICFLSLLLGWSQFSLAQASQGGNEFYNMANDVYSWHEQKSNQPLVVIKPNQPKVKLNIQNNNTNNINNTVNTNNLNSETTAPVEANASSDPILNNQANPTNNANAIDNQNAGTEQNTEDLVEQKKSLRAQLPSYRQLKKSKELKKLEESSTKFTKWKKPRSADSSLSKYGSNVAYLSTQKNFLLDDDNEQLKPVPQLDVGVERRVNKKDFFTKGLSDLVIEYKTPDPLPSPSKISRTELTQAALLKNKVGKTRRLKGKSWELGPVVKVNEINEIQYNIAVNTSFELKEVDPLSKYDVFMLSALIFKKKQQFPLALGLFDEVSQSEKHRQEANYNMGEIAYNLKLYSEAAHRLIPLVTKNNEYRADALSILFKNFPKEHESKISLALSKMEDRDSLPEKYMNKIYYYMGKAQFDLKDYKSARYTAGQVSQDSKLYDHAQFIKGLSEYLDKDLTQAVQTLTTLQVYLEKKSKEEKNIASLVALNLGRIFFQLKKYKQAYHSYKRIHKSHPLWVQAVTELGWVQLAMGDQFGAIGNMYSMHSPYFKAVYMPETYAIKTVGYLNICQYADAYKSMTLHEKTYRKWKTQIDNYFAANKIPGLVYKTVIKYLAGKSSSDVDGLPYQVTREIARQKDFLNIQNDINDKIDESKNYNLTLTKFNQNKKKVSQSLKKYKGELKQAKEKIKVAKNTNDEDSLNFAKKDLINAKEFITAYYFQLRLFDHSRKKLHTLKTKTQARIKAENSKLVAKASQVLFDNLKQIQSDNNSLLDNNELLRYEIFAGSGENIRFQVTGGKVKNENRIPASVKPKKALNWDFSGEYWEDEIGNYRTTLVDKCPK